MIEINIRDLENLAFGVTKSSHRNIKYVKLSKGDKTAEKAFNLLRGEYPGLKTSVDFPQYLSIECAIFLLFFCLASDDLSKLSLFSKVKFKNEGKTAVYRSTNEERDDSNDFEMKFIGFLDELKSNSSVEDYIDGIKEVFNLGIEPAKFHPETNEKSIAVFTCINDYLNSNEKSDQTVEDITLGHFRNIFKRLESPEVSQEYYNDLLKENKELKERIYKNNEEDEEFWSELYFEINRTMTRNGTKYTSADIDQVINLFCLDYENQLNELLEKLVKKERKLKQNLLGYARKIDDIESYLR